MLENSIFPIFFSWDKPSSPMPLRLSSQIHFQLTANLAARETVCGAKCKEGLIYLTLLGSDSDFFRYVIHLQP